MSDFSLLCSVIKPWEKPGEVPFFFFFRLEGSECWHTGGLGLMRALSPRRFCQQCEHQPGTEGKRRGRGEKKS